MPSIQRILAASLFFASAVAQAAPVTVFFQGEVEADEAFGFAAGTQLSGQFAYDTAAEPLFGPIEMPETGSLLASYMLDSFQIQVGGQQINVDMTRINTVDNVDPSMEDGQFLEGYGFTHDGTSHAEGVVYLNLVGPSTLRSDAALPTSYAFSDYTYMLGDVSKTSEFGAPSLRFTLTSISAVPEPSGWLLMLVGTTALALGTRVRRSKS
jgi:hypothetical protein